MCTSATSWRRPCGRQPDPRAWSPTSGGGARCRTASCLAQWRRPQDTGNSRLTPRTGGATSRGSASTPRWRTGHAVLAAAPAVGGPFAVVNADDFYGRDGFTRAAEFLAVGHAGESPATFANVAYPLRDTLSAAGGVNRAVCRADGDGWLESMGELVDIRHLGGAGKEEADR